MSDNNNSSYPPAPPYPMQPPQGGMGGQVPMPPRPKGPMPPYGVKMLMAGKVPMPPRPMGGYPIAGKMPARPMGGMPHNPYAPNPNMAPQPSMPEEYSSQEEESFDEQWDNATQANEYDDESDSESFDVVSIEDDEPEVDENGYIDDLKDDEPEFVEENIEEENPYAKNFASDFGLPPFFVRTKFLLFSFVFVVSISAFLGFGFATFVKSEQSVLSGVVENSEIPNGRPRCGLAQKGQGCVLYVMNAQRREVYAKDFFTLASEVLGIPKFQIETANIRYSVMRIPPGYIALLNIPPVQ